MSRGRDVSKTPVSYYPAEVKIVAAVQSYWKVNIPCEKDVCCAIYNCNLMIKFLKLTFDWNENQNSVIAIILWSNSRTEFTFQTTRSKTYLNFDIRWWKKSVSKFVSHLRTFFLNTWRYFHLILNNFTIKRKFCVKLTKL